MFSSGIAGPFDYIHAISRNASSASFMSGPTISRATYSISVMFLNRPSYSLQFYRVLAEVRYR